MRDRGDGGDVDNRRGDEGRACVEVELLGVGDPPRLRGGDVALTACDVEVA